MFVIQVNLSEIPKILSNIQIYLSEIGILYLSPRQKFKTPVLKGRQVSKIQPDAFVMFSNLTSAWGTPRSHGYGQENISKTSLHNFCF
jgi:hypothetical protein